LGLHLSDAVVHIYLDQNAAGEVKEALTFLAKSESRAFLHLNFWSRPKKIMTVVEIVKDIWRAWWEHELENRKLGRVQWMCSETLPQPKTNKIQLDLSDLDDIQGC
jgi:hypothetical protein